MVQGLLDFSEEYFKGETREGFYVDETMKRVWAAELEMLRDITDICDKYGLPWYADWGTLLGTVRHKGFVPWDDDLDIALKRADYQKLMQILPGELPKGWVILSPFSEKEYQKPMMRVVNSREVGFTPERVTKFHGCPFIVGLDIFPLDCIPRDENEAKMLDGLMTLLMSGVLYKHTEESRERILLALEDALHIKLVRDETIVNQLLRLVNQLGAGYGEEEGDYLTNWPIQVQRTSRNLKLKKEWYERTVRLPFENLLVSAPAGYDEVLCVMYGDWRVPRQNVGGHGYPFYKEQLEALRSKLQEMEAGQKC